MPFKNYRTGKVLTCYLRVSDGTKRLSFITIEKMYTNTKKCLLRISLKMFT